MSQQIHFLPFDSLPGISRGNGIANYLIASKKVGARAIHSGISKLPVGISAARHSRNAEERDQTASTATDSLRDSLRRTLN